MMKKFLGILALGLLLVGCVQSERKLTNKKKEKGEGIRKRSRPDQGQGQAKAMAWPWPGPGPGPALAWPWPPLFFANRPGQAWDFSFVSINQALAGPGLP